jgi:hypothetical protein
MEFWIEDGKLLTWTDSRKIQEKVIATGVIDGDYNSRLDEWLITKSNGVVESLNSRLFTNRTYSKDGISARWSSSGGVVIRESDGKARAYDYRGFLERTL